MSEGKRRLAAIVAADVVSYSAQIGTDEPATLARVRTLRTDLIEPLAATHGGRLFKMLGDGFLLEFVSAVQALRCAIAIQTALNAQPWRLRQISAPARRVPLATRGGALGRARAAGFARTARRTFQRCASESRR